MSEFDQLAYINPEPEANELVTFERAEAFAEESRPRYLKTFDTPEDARRRAEHRHAYIALALAEDGVMEPISRAHTEQLDGTDKPVLLLPYGQWKKLIARADLARLGYKID